MPLLAIWLEAELAFVVTFEGGTRLRYSRSALSGMQNDARVEIVAISKTGTGKYSPHAFERNRRLRSNNSFGCRYQETLASLEADMDCRLCSGTVN